MSIVNNSLAIVLLMDNMNTCQKVKQKHLFSPPGSRLL